MRKYLLSIVTNQISILRSFHAELVSKTLKQDEKSRGMSWTWTMYCPSQARNQKKKEKIFGIKMTDKPEKKKTKR